MNKYIKNNILKVIVKPNSRKTEVVSYDEGREAVKIAVAAPLEDNKAKS
ncbi:MAG: DUF167 domain-containing protein [Candidatus Woesearchaeota archaeon]